MNATNRKTTTMYLENKIKGRWWRWGRKSNRKPFEKRASTDRHPNIRLSLRHRMSTHTRPPMQPGTRLSDLHVIALSAGVERPYSCLILIRACKSHTHTPITENNTCTTGCWWFRQPDRKMPGTLRQA